MAKFWIEGTIIDEKNMNDGLMKQHMAYTQKAMNKGSIFMSGLKTDMSGGICIMIAENKHEVECYLQEEPLYKHGIQKYRVVEFDAHYLNEECLDEKAYI